MEEFTINISTLKRIKQFILFIVSMIFIIGFVFFYWTSNTYQPTKELLNEIKDQYTYEDNTYYFTPKDDIKAGIVFYPGALVEPLAYGHIANELAKQGYLVAIPNVKFNLSYSQNNRATDIIHANPTIINWYTAGHGMGGSSAIIYASRNERLIKGTMVLASYPALYLDYSDKNIHVLSIYGDRDGVYSKEDIFENKKYLPKDTIYHEIAGANHEQFGDYGHQIGDIKAEISAKHQQDQTIKYMLEFLNGTK